MHVSPNKLAAALIMPFLLGGHHLRAQITASNTLPASPSELFVTSSSSVTGAQPMEFATGAGVELPPPPRRQPSEPGFRPFSTAAMAVTANTLGSGLQIATPLSRTFNLRLGGNYVHGAYPFARNGLNYGAAMKLTSGQTTVDWFPRSHAFHISAGALYFKSSIKADASVDPGAQFKLGDTWYTNSVTDPVHGSASLSFPRRLAPMMLVGFGNLLPRSGRHISVPFELGGAYMGQPHVNMQLAGTACSTGGCFNTASDPATQADLQSQLAQINTAIHPMQVYPIISLGLSVRY